MSLHEKSSKSSEIENHSGKNRMFWPTASALGLLDAESKNFIFVLQGHCDLHVKCCRRMQPDVTGFSKVRMVDLDGFKQCKLGLRYVNFAPLQTARAVLRGQTMRVEKHVQTRKRKPNWQHKWDILQEEGSRNSYLVTTSENCVGKKVRWEHNPTL